MVDVSIFTPNRRGSSVPWYAQERSTRSIVSFLPKDVNRWKLTSIRMTLYGISFETFKEDRGIAVCEVKVVV